jgi:hypothetical protein
VHPDETGAKLKLKMKFAVVALVLVLVLAMAAPLNAESQPHLTIDVVRVVALGQWGILHLLDNYRVHYDNGSAPVSYLDFGFSRMYRNNVFYVVARDSSGKNLTVDADLNPTSDVYWMRIHFGQDLGVNQTYEFRVAMVMDGLVTEAVGGFQYNFTAAPILTQDARMANVTFVAVQASNFVLPSNSTYLPITLNGLPALFREYKPWKAYSDEAFYAPYSTVNQYLVDLKSAERDITVDNTGTLSVKDTYNLYNLGIPITSMAITLPAGASNVMAYDPVGAMWTSQQNPTAPYQVTVSPRYTAGVRSRENFTFTLTYNLPPSKYLKQLTWWGTYNLTIGLLNNREDLLFDNATVRIITPDGVSVSDVKIPAQSPLSDPITYDAKSREFTLEGISTMNNLTVGLTLNYSPFWSAFGSLPWLVGLELAIAAFALAVTVRRGPELAVPVPVENLRDFVGLYDERLALSRELVVMEDDVARGGMVKHEFRRRAKLMELRLDEINKSLMGIKSELRVVSPRYDELIRRIDRAEAEIQVSRTSLSQVRTQYRAGKTTRETYDAMVNDITKRIDRAEETVETILITLREDAR